MGLVRLGCALACGFFSACLRSQLGRAKALMASSPGMSISSVSGSTIWGVIALFRRVMEPKFVGDQTGLSPILSLVSIYVGMKLAGVLGMILGPTVASSPESGKTGTVRRSAAGYYRRGGRCDGPAAGAARPAVRGGF